MIKRDVAKKELMNFIDTLDTTERVKKYWKSSIY